MQTALVVEDCFNTAQWTMRLLNKVFPDIKTSHCSNFQSTIEHLSVASSDIVLLDINLPDGSGLDLIPLALRSSPNAVVVMTTIVDDKESILKAIQQGANGYILKGLSEHSFLQKLQCILKGNPPLSPSIAQQILQYIRDINESSKVIPVSEPLTDNMRDLTHREIEVLIYLAQGYSRKETAGALYVSESTIATHGRHIYRKLDISNRAEATLKAYDMGLITNNPI